MRIAYPSLLSGLAHCGHCGAAMVYHAQASRNWPFYICGKRDRQKATRPCNGRRINARKVNALILDTVLNRILTPGYFDALLAELKNQMADTASLEAEIEDKRADLRSIERAIHNLLELAEVFGSETVLERIKCKEGERLQLAAEIKGFEARREMLKVEIAPEALALVLNTWRVQIIETNESGDIAALRSLLARFVEKIELEYTTVKIFFAYPIDSLNRPRNDSFRGGTKHRKVVFILLYSIRD
jgi:hypothetical protein